MGFFEDLGNNISNLFGNKATPPPGSSGTMGWDPSTNAPIMGGSADIGAASGMGSAPSPSPASATSPPTLLPSSSDPVGNPTSSAQNPNQGQMLLQTMLGMAEQPALPTDQISRALQGMNVDKIDYLNLAKQNYNNLLGQIQGIQNNVNSRYDQVGTDMNDLWNQDSNAARLGGNNVLTAIAGNQGQAIQNNAANAANTLANLKNSQLAQRAQIAAQAGQNPAGAPQGDAWRIDPNEVAVQGIVQNAQQAANNANAAAADRTQLNNEMADAMKAQGNVMQQQLQNERLGYNSSMGKYMADLANQESNRELEAVKQNRSDQLAILSAQIGLQEKQAELENGRMQALFGNRGFPSIFTDLGQYGLDNAKAAQAIAAATAGGSPIASAIQNAGQYGQPLQSAYNQALMGSLNLTPGTKPTYEDLYRAMAPNAGNVPQDVFDNFVQQATAAKPAPNGSIDDITSMLQGLM